MKKASKLTLLTVTVISIWVLLVSPANTEIFAAEPHVYFNNMDDFLGTVAWYKFGERDPLMLATASGSMLRELRRLFTGGLWEGFSLSEIRICPSHTVPTRFTYSRGEETVSLYRYHHQEPVTERIWPHTRSIEGGEYILHWTAFGILFKATIPISLTEEEGFHERDLYAFANALPSNPWEIRGDAVSVYIKNKENIIIIDDNGNEIFVGADVPLIRWNNLYRLNADGTRSRLGFFSRIGPGHYQYVLAPGVYTFHAKDAIGEPELLVQHFVDHEIVSSVDLTELLTAQSASQFVLAIDALAANQTLLPNRDLEGLRRFRMMLNVSAITDLLSDDALVMDTVPVIQLRRTIVPISFVAEKLGATVEWDETTRTVTILLDDQELSLTIGELSPGMDIPAQIINGRTMVPLRFISESLGAIVNWNPDARTIEVIR